MEGNAMKVNPLPARTWNWLKMNDTVLNENVMTERGNMTIEKPESGALFFHCNRNGKRDGRIF